MQAFTFGIALTCALLTVTTAAAQAPATGTRYEFIQDSVPGAVSVSSGDLAGYSPRGYRVVSIKNQDGTVSAGFSSGIDKLKVVPGYGSVRLDRAGNAVAVTADGTLVRRPYGSDAYLLPQAPGTINDDGQTTLTANEYTFTVSTKEGLFLYSYETGRYVLLDTDRRARALCSANRGYVAGQISEPQYGQQPAVWFFGNRQQFAAQPGASAAVGVNEFGRVLGHTNLTRASSSYSSYAWTASYGNPAVTPIPGMSVAVALNNADQAVGMKPIPAPRSQGVTFEGVLYEKLTGKTTELRELFASTGFVQVRPTAINDRGEITVNALRGGAEVSGILVPKRTINAWWVKDGQAATGTQPFMFSLNGASGDVDVAEYRGSWAADGDFANMTGMQAVRDYGTSFMRSSVDLGGWNWRNDATYYVTYVATDAAGNPLAVETHRFYRY